MYERITKVSATRSVVRAAVEQVFARQKHRMRLFIRTISMRRAQIKIGMAKFAYYIQRLACLKGPTALA